MHFKFEIESFKSVDAAAKSIAKKSHTHTHEVASSLGIKIGKKYMTAVMSDNVLCIYMCRMSFFPGKTAFLFGYC